MNDLAKWFADRDEAVAAPLRARIEQLEAEIAANELAMRAASAGLQMAKTKIEQLKALLRTCRELLPQHYVQIIDAIDDATGLNAVLAEKEGT